MQSGGISDAYRSDQGSQAQLVALGLVGYYIKATPAGIRSLPIPRESELVSLCMIVFY